MKFELKNVKYAAFASEETACYEASLYVDGKRIGQVSNQGHGGCDDFHGDDKAYREANEWLKANETWDTKVVFGASADALPDEMPVDIEHKCSGLLDQWLLERDLKNGLKRKVLFTQPNEKGVFQVAKRGNPVDAIKNALRERHGGGLVFLDDLPFADAAKVYKEGTA